MGDRILRKIIYFTNKDIFFVENERKQDEKLSKLRFF